MFAPIAILVFLSCAVAGNGFEQKLIFDGMSLPVDWNFTTKFFPNLTFAAASVTTQFNVAYIPLSVATIGKNKTDPTTKMLYSKYQEGYIKTAILTPFPEGYLHFGDGDDFANLPHLLKNNVFFMASVISASNKTFKIDPFGKRGQTYFSQFIANLKFTVPRVSATFDSEMNVINMKVYSSLNPNTELTGYSLQKKAVLLIYQCSYYAQNIHASVHVSEQIFFISTQAPKNLFTRSSLNNCLTSINSGVPLHHELSDGIRDKQYISLLLVEAIHVPTVLKVLAVDHNRSGSRGLLNRYAAILSRIQRHEQDSDFGAQQRNDM